MSILGIGLRNCSSSMFFILCNTMFKNLRNVLFNFNFVKLSNHETIKTILKYFSYFIFGLIFKYISTKKRMSEKELSKISRPEKKKTNASIDLIYEDSSEYVTSMYYSSLFRTLLVSLIFILHDELTALIYFLGIGALDIWSFDFTFTYLYMKRFFVLTNYRHQKLSIYLISILCPILLIISTFFPYTEGKTAYQTIEESTQYYIIVSFLFLFLFLLISLVNSFGRVQAKKLMDLKFISPYSIMIYTGLIGLLLSIISLIISTSTKCKTNTNALINNLCKLKGKNNEKYYDNLFLYFSELIGKSNNEREKYYELYAEILVIIPLFIIFSFCEFYCELFTIYDLNPIYVIIKDNLFYVPFKIFNFVNNKMSLLQFILLESAEMISLLANLIYLEFIELRFCNLDKNLKRKLILKAKIEDINNFLISDDDESDDEDDDNNNNNKVRENNKMKELK